MNKTILWISTIICMASCADEAPLLFSEMNFTSEKQAIVEVNVPRFEGRPEISNKVNAAIENQVITSITPESNANTIEEASRVLDADFLKFKRDISEGLQPWEAFVDGEVTYNSSELISIAFNTYLNTGAAHGHSVITFLNFNPSTGALYTYDDIVQHLDDVNALVEEHFRKTIAEELNSNEMTTYDFRMPESFGFSEEGMIVVYNTHELQDLSLNALEFTIPFSEVNNMLNLGF